MTPLIYSEAQDKIIAVAIFNIKIQIQITYSFGSN